MDLNTLALGPLKANCYILCCEETNQALVIDPGADEPALLEAVEGYEVPTIIATHGHWDHVSGVPYLQSHKHSKFYIHHAELDCLRKWAGERDLSIKSSDFVTEGDIVKVGNIRLRVLHMPGHSPGHLVLMEENERWLFTGDLLLRGGTGGANVEGGNPELFVQSIDRLRDLEGDWKIFPGHFESSTMAWEREHNPYIKFKIKEAKMSDLGAV